ncbi:MAG: D-aminopeptidase [Alphaproteobacteria bacterium]|nr:D-aminopeptidase [Alphaproteobacteria bacterium]
MPSFEPSALETAAARLAETVRGPGGAVGATRNGAVVLSHVWGHADPKRHLPVTTATRFPVCSISKQFTCGALLSLVGDPDDHDGFLKTGLPNFETARPRIRHLCHNQSGLRDYWALTGLHGANPGDVFRREDARLLFARMRSTHFAPGSRYSYSNGNFRLLSDLIEEVSGRSLGEVLRRRLFDPAGMPTAELIADTTLPADGTVGHEGNPAVGFFPAVNRIVWSGDAGISASLDDMLAWERHIDATRDDESGLYRRLSAPQTFSDGRAAPYGFGLAHDRIGSVATTGHGGALRGFRAYRLYAPSERVSVVVLFNHEASAHDAALRLMRAALGLPPDAEPEGAADPGWAGNYLDPETGLLWMLAPDRTGLSSWFTAEPEHLCIDAADTARSPAVTLRRRSGEFDYERWRENLRGTARRVTGRPRPDIAGRYHARELDAHFEIGASGGALFGYFEGFLGRGDIIPIYPVADDLWVLPSRRALDAPAPGNWTIRVERDASGAVSSLVLGCWLARDIRYARLAA